MKTKNIRESIVTRVPNELLDAVRAAHKARKSTEPKLRKLDIWYELIGSVDSNKKQTK